MLTLGPLPPRLSNLMAEDPSYDCIKVPSPLQRTPLEQRFPHFPDELMEVVKRCLALDPNHRLSADEAMKMPYFSDVPQIMAAVAHTHTHTHNFWSTLDASWQQQTMASSNGSASKPAPPSRRSAAQLRTSRSCSQRSLSHSLPLPKHTQPPLVAANSTSASGSACPEVAVQGANQLSEPQLQMQAQQAQAQMQQALLAQAQVQQAKLKQAQVQQAALANHPPLNAANLLSQQAALLQQPQQQQQHQQHMLPHIYPNHPSQLHQHHSTTAPSFGRASHTSSAQAHASNYSMACTGSSVGVAGGSHGDSSTHGSSFHSSFHRPSTPGSAGSSATYITAPLTPLPIQQLRRAMSNAQMPLSGVLGARTSSTGHSECPSMALLSECSSLHRAASGTPGGTPDASLRHVPNLSSLLSNSSRLGGSSDMGSCRLSETSISTPGHYLAVDLGSRKSFQYNSETQESLFSRKSLTQQQQQHHHQNQHPQQHSTPPGSFLYVSGGSPMGGVSPTRHLYSLSSSNMQLPGGAVGSSSQHAPSSRRSSQVLQLQPGFPASRLSVLNSSMSSPRHRRHPSGGWVGNGVPLASGASWQGNLGVSKRGLASNSMGNIAEVGQQQQQQQGAPTSPTHHSSHAPNNPHPHRHSSYSIPGSLTHGITPTRHRSASGIPPLGTAAASAFSSQQGDALPASGTSRDASSASSGGRQLASAFAAPDAQDMASSGSPQWAAESITHPLAEEGEDASCAGESGKQHPTEQSAEHGKAARQLPALAQSRGASGVHPQQREAGAADSDAGAAAKLAAMDSQERAGAGQPQASDASAQGRDASSKHPSFFKLVKSRLSSLTTFRNAVKQ
ncbi:hypothetical protein DUNSADRAFT_483 [Dunaliella salina]|uniref:Uncharacterized protein n=1 Tax=Dunaliella salina TaxID=3046 RepID=A0ABQ7FYV0_DUNSA|nr:hypothetical protein DUNSADRAFT_483 [Dunaliella salina]|eukprot:KAF5827536.1 hypothetical protein DUNSADRAFT_483 [Dunaliella salina]